MWSACEKCLKPCRYRFCSAECRLEWKRENASANEGDEAFSERLHDGMRLLSDDFCQRDGDEFTTFEK